MEGTHKYNKAFITLYVSGAQYQRPGKYVRLLITYDPEGNPFDTKAIRVIVKGSPSCQWSSNFLIFCRLFCITFDSIMTGPLHFQVLYI